MYDNKQDPEHKITGVTMGWMPPIVYDTLVHIVTCGREDTLRREYLDLANIGPGHKVLDIGCGTGTCVLLLSDDVGPTGEVVGVDPTASFVVKAKKKADKQQKTNVRFEKGSAQDLKKTTAAMLHCDNAYDVVLSSFAFHHMPGEELQLKVLAEMSRVLKPGGRLLIVDFPEGHHPGTHTHHHQTGQGCCGYCYSGKEEEEQCQISFEKEPLFQRIQEAGFHDVRAQRVQMMESIAFLAQK